MIRESGTNKTPLYGFWFFNMLYNDLVRRKLEYWIGELPSTAEQVDKFLDAEIVMTE